MLEIAMQKKFSFLFVVQVALISVVECTSNTDIIRHCVSVSPCIETFANIYNALVSDDNSFNIGDALYPAKKPSSVRVFVNVYGPNKTDNSTTDTKYTWSMNCLYAAIPAEVLEILSVGSILVTSRTQELNITIPQFCCNVSVEKRQKMIEDVLASLQDLAKNPRIRDPSLNTADCVTVGHEPNISSTGRSLYINGILWSTFFSVMLLGPLLAFVILGVLRSHEEEDCYCPLYPACLSSLSSCCSSERCYHVGKPLVLSVNCIVHFLLFIEIVILIKELRGRAPKEISIFLPIISLEGLAMYILTCFTYICCCPAPIINTAHYCKRGFSNKTKQDSVYRVSVFIACSNLVLYHVCWLTVGIMINPIWGLTVLLIFSLVIAALFFTVYQICNVDGFCTSFFIQRFVFYAPGFLGLCFALAIPIIAAQSFYGRENADDILNTALLYVFGIFGSWKFWKSKSSPASSPAPATAYTLVPSPATAPSPAPTSAPAPVSSPAAAHNAPSDDVELEELGEQRRPLLP